MKILTNANYEEIINKLNDQLGEIVELQSKYGLLKANYNANINVIKELNGRIGGLTKEINRTKEQNDKLKKQLENKYKKVGTLTSELLYEENTKLINQQKEFIKWLEDEIQNKREKSTTLTAFIRNVVPLQQCLQKYKRIIGDDK